MQIACLALFEVNEKKELSEKRARAIVGPSGGQGDQSPTGTIGIDR
jgi:hypothetical protein